LDFAVKLVERFCWYVSRPKRIVGQTARLADLNGVARQLPGAAVTY
jgi:hypothetical protein